MAKSLGWYQPEQMILKITLAGSEPKIWRRVQVDSGLTLHDLHVVIQCVFDWDNSHLYQFLVPVHGKLTQRAMSEAIHYRDPRCGPLFEEQKNDPLADEAMVGRVLNGDQKQIVYEYDFGDSWEHVVKVEKRLPGGDPANIPQCLAGENAAPLDDSGGIDGYYQWLDALRDKSNDMHKQAVDWLGKSFDSTHFDLGEANKQLAAAFKPIRQRPRKKRK